MAGKKGRRSSVRQIRRKARVRRMYQTLGVMSAVLIVVLLYVWQNIQVDVIGYRIRDLESDIKKQKSERASLQLRICELDSLERIDAIARRDLGMVSDEGWPVILVDAKPFPPVRASVTGTVRQDGHTLGAVSRLQAAAREVLSIVALQLGKLGVSAYARDAAADDTESR